MATTRRYLGADQYSGDTYKKNFAEAYPGDSLANLNPWPAEAALVRRNPDRVRQQVQERLSVPNLRPPLFAGGTHLRAAPA